MRKKEAQIILHEFVAQVEAGLCQALTCAPSEETVSQLTANERFLVALSGGPDSTALLLAMQTLQKKYGFQLFAAHVNHNLRGSESDRDEQFCQDLCLKHKIRLKIEHLHDLERDPSEEELRCKRYKALRQMADTFGSRKLILGHTLDDQVETLVFRLLRGTSPYGLTGMSAVRSWQEISLLRPMLAISRAACLNFLSSAGVSAMNDSSNDNLNYSRNFIRHKIIPPMRKLFPGFETKLEKFRHLLSEDEELLKTLTCQAIIQLEKEPNCDLDHWSVPEFLNLAPALQKRVLARSMESRGIEVSFERIESVRNLALTPGRLSLNSEWDVQSKRNLLIWLNKNVDSKAVQFAAEVRIPGITPLLNLGKALHVDEFTQNEAKFPESDADEAIVDLTLARLPLIVRNRLPDDRIRPFGMNNLVKIKKYLHCHQAKETLGSKLSPIVLADQDEVIWIFGVGISNKLKVTNRPTHKMSLINLARDEISLC